MRTWIRRSLIGLAAALGVTAAIGAATGVSHCRGGWHAMGDEDGAKMRERFVEMAASRLDLDATQRQKLQALAERMQQQRRALVDAADPRAPLRALIAGPAFDRAGAEALLDAKTAALRAGAPETIAAMGDFFDALRPEQQQQLRQMLERRHR